MKGGPPLRAVTLYFAGTEVPRKTEPRFASLVPKGSRLLPQCKIVKRNLTTNPAGTFYLNLSEFPTG